MTATYLYHYDEQGLNRGVRTEARISPMDPTVPLVPKNATLVEPIQSLTENRILKFNEATNLWEEIFDYRGYTYWTPELGEVTEENVGIDLPANAVKSDPATPIILDEDTGLWRYWTTDDDDKKEEDDLVELKKQLIETNRLIVGNAIAAFTGTTYDTPKMRDKQTWYIIRSAELKGQEYKLEPGADLPGEDRDELANLRYMKNDSRAFMTVENDTAELINSASNAQDAIANSELVLPDITHDPSIKIK